MAFLVHPLPPVPVYVKKEYLYDLEKGHGELTPGIWISVKSTKYKSNTLTYIHDVCERKLVPRNIQTKP